MIFTGYSTRLILLFTLFCFSISAQNKKIESLLAKLAIEKNDTNKVNTLHSLGNAFCFFKPDTSITIVNEALALAKKLNWKKGHAQSEHLLGIYSFLKNEAEKSIAQYNKAILLWHELINSGDSILFRAGKAGLCKSTGNLGVVYSQIGNEVKSLTCYLEALKIAEEMGFKQMASTEYAHVSSFYLQQKNPDKSLEYSLKSLKIETELQNYNGKATALVSIANSYSQKKNVDKAKEYYNMALKIFEELNAKPQQASVLNNISTLFQGQKKYAESVEYLLHSLKISEEINDRRLLAFGYSNLGLLHTNLKKYQDSEKYLLKSLLLSNQINEKKLAMETEAFLYKLYEFWNKPVLALSHYKKFISLRDSLSNVENEKKFVRAEMNYEFNKKEFAAKAEQNKKDAIAKEERQKQLVLRNAFIGGFVLILIVAVVVYRSYKLKRKANQELDKKNKTILLQKKEVEEQKRMIEEKQKEIIDSINYARRIQNSLLPTEKYIHSRVSKKI